MEKDKVDAVRKMQDYIKANISNELSAADIAKAAGYSQRHCKRIFTELTGRPVAEYIRLIRLTAAAEELKEGTGTVLDIALTHRYHSHEGFTKAFSGAFGVAPSAYRKNKPPIRLFVPYPVDHQYILRKEGNVMTNTENSMPVCTATIVDREKRKIVFLPAKTATDYMSFCQEKGCEWEGLLNSFDKKFDTAAILTLPQKLTPQGCTGCAAGVEVPFDYSGDIPQGYQTAVLEAGKMLYFQSEPYENEEDFCKAIEQAYSAYEKYDPKRFGFEYDYQHAPSFNFGAWPSAGGRLAFPVKKIVSK